jgi:hypothetical protein
LLKLPVPSDPVIQMHRFSEYNRIKKRGCLRALPGYLFGLIISHPKHRPTLMSGSHNAQRGDRAMADAPSLLTGVDSRTHSHTSDPRPACHPAVFRTRCEFQRTIQPTMPSRTALALWIPGCPFNNNMSLGAEKHLHLTSGLKQCYRSTCGIGTQYGETLNN